MSCKILVVEDEDFLREEILAALEELGYTALPAKDGKDALAIVNAQNGEFDLILSDIRMPKMDGLTLLEKLSKAHPHLPVAMMTGHGDLETAVKALRAAAFDFITKPFGLDELEDLLRKLKTRSEILHPVAGRHTVAYEETYSLRIPSKLSYISEVVTHLRKYYIGIFNYAGVNPHSVGLCLTEALNNAVVHGNLEVSSALKDQADGWSKFSALIRARENDAQYSNKHVTLDCRVLPDLLEITVTDEGAGFNYAELPDPSDPASMLSHGRGLILMQNIMDEVSWEAPGNKISMRMYLKESRTAQD